MALDPIYNLPPTLTWATTIQCNGTYTKGMGGGGGLVGKREVSAGEGRGKNRGQYDQSTLYKHVIINNNCAKL